jgi:hypothetical protein
VSVKPTALSPRFAPSTGSEGLDAAAGRLAPLLARAGAGAGDRVTVHLDTEHDDVKDLGF